MDNEHDNIAAADDPPTQPPQAVERLPWEQVIVPVEPDEAGETEEGEAESEEDGESEGEHLDEYDETALAPSDEEIATELSDLQAAADEESRGLGLPLFDGDEFRQALIASGAEGLELAEEDLPAFNSYFAAQREAGASATEIGRALGWYLRMQAETSQARYDADLAHKAEMEALIHNEWGDGASERLEELRDFMGGLPGRLGEAFVDARTSDGRRLIDNPDWPLVMSDLIRGNGSPRSNAQDRLAKITAVLKRDPQRYFREGLDKEALALRRQTIGERNSDEAPGRAPISGREKQILEVMKRDMSEYFRRGLDRELAEIRAARAAKGQ
jgi:hypothetical protein